MKLIGGNILKEVLKNLKMLQIDQIYYHETHERYRSDKIASAIKEDGILLNPPIVLALEDDRYMLLDGAHRVKAIENIGCPRIVVQVVDEEDITLEAWQHLVPKDWLGTLDGQVQLRQIGQSESGDQPLAEIICGNGVRFEAYTRTSHPTREEHLSSWHALVDAYSQKLPVQRIPNHTRVLPKQEELLVRFPSLTVEELKSLVFNQQMLPAGVTRFLIFGRILNLCVPLYLLQGTHFDEQAWMQMLKKWNREIRFYSEPIYVMES